MAKVLTKVLKALVGKSPHQVHSTQDFVEQANKVTLMPGESLSSYDVIALFTSVPVDPALCIIKEFCLKNAYFSFHNQYYEQVEGAAMGSLVSPIVANLYMKYFEQKALSTATHPPKYGSSMWMTLWLSKGKK